MWRESSVRRPRAVQHGARAEHAPRRQPRQFRRPPGEHVHRIGNHQKHAFRRVAHGRGHDGIDHRQVFLRQIHPGFAALLVRARGDDHKVRIRKIRIVPRAHQHRRRERRPVLDIQRLAPRALLVRIDEHNFAGQARLRKRERRRRAHQARADYANLVPHTISPEKKMVDGGARYPQFAMVTLLRLAACSVPWLIGLTSRCFAHSARASCAPRHCQHAI